jgi:hypothetical protein
LIEESVALRHQSVEIPSLVEMIRRRSLVIPNTVMPRQPETVDAMVEQDGDREADVALWHGSGSRRGAGRVTLCRSFGLNVVGYYPKVIVPFPQEELEAFARTVDRVVLVESSQMQGYEERLRAALLVPVRSAQAVARSRSRRWIFFFEKDWEPYEPR